MDIVKLERLKALQADLDNEYEIVKSLKQDFELEHKARFDKIISQKKEIEELKVLIHADACDEFEKTGEKKLLGGIGIRVKKTIDYNPKEAFEFAKEKGLFLQLDKRAFEKAAPDLGVDFVKVTEEPGVTFPKEIKL